MLCGSQHVLPNTSATCIDLFIINRPNLILDIKVSPNFCSDHCPISVDINIKTSKEQCYKRTIRKYDQADYNSIIHEMEGKNWSILFENKTVNQNYSNFLSILNEACDKHIPTKTVVIRPDDKPFMNSSIRKAIRKRNRIHYRAKSTKDPDHWSQYIHLRNDVIRLVREAKTEYKNNLTSQIMDKSIPPDKWWRIAKSVCKLNKCNKVSPPIKHEGRIIIHSSEK